MNSKKYLDKVIERIVRDTKIDYKKHLIDYPFYSVSPNIRFEPINYPLYLDTHPMIINFSKYCEDIYGLSILETDYVWEKYKSIIKEKVNKRNG